MALIASLPTISVEVSFTPPFSTPSWVDISNFVRGFTTTAGRQHELDQINPSTATVTLDNRDGRFFPWNTTGPYWGEGGTGLVPEMSVKITATWASTVWPVFYGYIDSWVPSWKNPSSTDVTVSASDMLGLFAVNNMNLSGYPNQVLADGAVGYWRLNDVVGSTIAADSSGNGNTATAVGSTITFGEPGALPTNLATACLVDNTSSLFYGVSAPASPPLVSSSTGMSIEFWYNSTDAGPDYESLVEFNGTLNGTQVSMYVGLFASAGGDNLQLCSAGSFSTGLVVTDAAVQNGGWHHVVGTVAASGTGGEIGALALYVDGVLVGSQAGSSAAGTFFAAQQGILSLGATGSGASFQEMAVYPLVLTGTQVLNHYTLGDFGSAVQYSGQLIEGICTLIGVPSGMLSIATGISEIQPVQSGSTLRSPRIITRA